MLHKFHYLPHFFQTEFKILGLEYKALGNQDLGDSCSPHDDAADESAGNYFQEQEVKCFQLWDIRLLARENQFSPFFFFK